MKSNITYFLLVISLIIFSFTYYPKFQKSGSEATISWDVSGYYWYLPAVFIYKDLKNLKFSDSIRSYTNCTPDNQQIYDLPNGKKVMKYSSGMAFQYLPYFLIANLLAKPFGYEQNGFSKPYQISLQIGAIVMMLLGLWFLRKLLLRYFEDKVVGWVLFFITIGTNYLNYSMIDVGMTHSWIFSWYCILMYFTDDFYKSPTKKSASLIGFVLGILMLTRPTEFIALIIPLGWGISSFSLLEFKNRFHFIIQHFLKYVFASLIVILIGGIQLCYWKYATGHWLVYSYGDQHFSFSHPHWLDYMFSFRCGWLIYCPILILPYLGYVYLFKHKINFLPLFIYALLNLWIVTSWDIWWYGGRAMIQGYAVLCFPLAGLITYVNKKTVLQIVFYPVALFLVYLNIWWTHGVHLGGYMMVDNVSKAYYCRVFPFMKRNNMHLRYLDVNEGFEGKLQDAETLLFDNFENDTTNVLIKNGVQYLHIPKNKTISKEFQVSKESTKKWIRFSANVICKQQNWDEWKMTFMGIKFMKNNQQVKYNAIKIDRLFYENDKLQIYIDAKKPLEDYDSIIAYFEQSENTQGEFLVENIIIQTFN